MKIKVFKTSDYEEVNKFIKKVDLAENGIQVTSENEIVIFYHEKLSSKQLRKAELERTIEQLEKNIIFNELNKEGFAIEANLASPEKQADKAVNLSKANEQAELFTKKLKRYKELLKELG